LTNLDFSAYEGATLRHANWSPEGAYIVFQLSGAGAMVGRVNADGTGLIWYQADLLQQPDWKP